MHCASDLGGMRGCKGERLGVRAPRARRRRSVRRRQRGDLGHRHCDKREERKFELDEES